MSNVLVINVTGQETRVALIERGILAELYIERKYQRGIVGNIYRGRVVRVLPGMQAAFVDIGTDRAAFLYVNDVLNEHIPFELADDETTEPGEPTDPGESPELGEAGLAGDSADAAEEADENDPERTPVDLDDGTGPPPGRRRRAPRQRIEEQLTQGQEILVQAAKDPIGTKGARLTSHITLPGRYLVFMPTVSHVGISRRILSESERTRLRALVEDFRPEGSGFIVRTAAQDVPSELLRQDMESLVELWKQILERRERVRAPALLHADLDLIPRAARDLMRADVTRVVVDDRGEYERIRAYIGSFMPDSPCEVELYTGHEPIFDAFGVEIEISRALQRKVWLPSGAYLVIDQTEALTAIDVNTGRYVGKTDLEDTITRINLEAIAEIVYQLRLRNIGGLVVIDFIDMESRDNREKVYNALAQALETDKARTNLLKISDFGLVEMTRRRVSESLAHQLCEPCPHCEGRGRVQSSASVAYEILRNVGRHARRGEGAELVISAHPRVTEFLQLKEEASLRALAQVNGAPIRVEPLRVEQLDDYSIGVRAPERAQGPG